MARRQHLSPNGMMSDAPEKVLAGARRALI